MKKLTGFIAGGIIALTIACAGGSGNQTQDMSRFASEFDPVCKMNMASLEISDSAEVQGKKYAFCSPLCKEKFVENPEQYMSADAGGGHGDHEGHDHEH